MNNSHFDYLDGWRAMALIFLMIGHFYPVPGLNAGMVGLNMFFVLSGLLMARILFVNCSPLPLFYKRRLARTMPAAFFFILTITLTYLVIGRQIDWPEVMTAIAFIKNYFPGQPDHAVMPFGHTWSLSLEEHSYFLLSLVALAARRKGIDHKFMILAFTILFASIGIFYWATYTGTRLAFDRWLHTEVSAFGIFISGFLFLRFRNGLSFFPPAIAYLGCFGLGIAVHWWSLPLPVTTIVGCTALALFVNLLAQAPWWIRAFFSCRPLRQLAMWSYSIYLWQQPFYLLVRREDMPVWLGVSLALGCGVASFYLVENPMRRYLNRKWVESKPERGPVTAKISEPSSGALP